MIVETADRLKTADEYYFSRKLEEIRKLRAQGSDVINLGIGSPDLAPASEVLEVTSQALASSKNHGYASYKSTPELRSAMAAWYKRTYKVDLDSESQILPLLGSKEGILYTSMAFLNPGDEVLIPNPGYPAYSSVANLLGAKVRYYDLKEESSWLPDLAALQKTDLSKIKLMWVNYPHMPTGAVGSEALFKDLVSFGRKNKILICNDNPYGLILNDKAPQSFLSFDPIYEVTMELNSLSKSFNMAGWRVGMALGSKPVIEALLQVKSNVDSGMFLPVQLGAAQALTLSDSWHDERNAIYRERRDLVWKIFDALGFSYDKKQVGLFVWAKAPADIPDVNQFVDELLHKTLVFITPGFIFGSNGSRYARSSLCVPKESLSIALQRIQKFLTASGAQT